MKKRGILALLLACSFAFGTFSATACNIAATDNNQQDSGQVGDGDNKGDNNQGGNDNPGDNTGTETPDNPGDNTGTETPDNPGDNTGTETPDNPGDNTGTETPDNPGDNTGTETPDNPGDNTGGDKEPETVGVSGVTLNKTSARIKVGETETLIATVLPDNANNKKVTWSSSNTSVATVVGGVVTALAVGDARITVTTEDGNKTDVCTVTVDAATVVTVPVSGVTVSQQTAEMKTGETLHLTATISPANASDKAVTWSSGNTAVATVNENGVVTAVSAGTATITVKSNAANYSATCRVTVRQETTAPVVDAQITYSYAGNESAAFEWSDNNVANAMVQYKLSTASSYTTLSGKDKQFLVRQKDSTTARVDFVGLKGGAVYEFKITTSGGKTLTASNVTIASYDRSGYAHFGKTDGVGAYNNDGTPKSNAVIVYVNESNKNTVKATVNGKERTGIVSILQNAGTSTPLIVRVVGTVGAATWNKLEYNNGNPITPDAVVGKNGTKLSKREWTQQELIDGGYNTLDTSVYSELSGLSSKIKYDTKKAEFDSAWNDCSIQNVKNVTVEGIGEDARLFQWGMTFKNSDSIEVRNLTFEDYTEDACSFEGGDTSASSLSAFSHGNIWVHHNVFEEGVNYWDVCNEQDKHDGDGSTDFKGLKNITLSYNVYNNTHKTGLIGGSNTQTTANVTFHHNAYNNCKARLPLARQANMHMYNNYYNCTTGTDISLRANAYAFVENCYFETNNSACKNVKHIELQYEDVKDSNGKVIGNRYGAAKLVGCVLTQTGDRITVADKIDKNASLYIGNDRQAKVTHVNTFGHDFDTDSSLFYYKDGKSDVTVMFSAEDTKKYVPQIAGVQKRGVDVTLDGLIFGGNTGGGTETPDPVDPVDPTPDTPSGTEIFNASSAGYAVGDNLANKSYSGNMFELSATGGVVTEMTFNDGTSGATAKDGTKFSTCFYAGGSSTSYTIKANKACTVTVYYTVSDRSLLTKQDYGKSGILTVDGTQITEDSDTAGNKLSGTAYAYTLTLTAGQSVVLKSSSNRLILFGVVAK